MLVQYVLCRELEHARSVFACVWLASEALCGQCKTTADCTAEHCSENHTYSEWQTTYRRVTAFTAIPVTAHEADSLAKACRKDMQTKYCRYVLPGAVSASITALFC